jgi:hypothetical protein
MHTGFWKVVNTPFGCGAFLLGLHGPYGRIRDGNYSMLDTLWAL